MRRSVGLTVMCAAVLAAGFLPSGTSHSTGVSSVPAALAAGTTNIWGIPCQRFGAHPDFPAPLGDYGDAPDEGFATGYPIGSRKGHFPTRFHRVSGATGAYTVRIDQEWLGPRASLERGATDPTDPDGYPNLIYRPSGNRAVPVRPDCDKHDDSQPSLSLGSLVGTSVVTPSRRFSALASIAAGAPDVPRYLNVVADINHDGYWNHGAGGTNEWIVRNCWFRIAPATSTVTKRVECPILLTPAGQSITRMTSHGKIIGFMAHPSYDPYLWFRVLLTRHPLPAGVYLRTGSGILRGWDGHGPSGGFPYGEVEDYFRPVQANPTPTPTATRVRPIPPTLTPTPPYIVITPTPTPTETPRPVPMYIPQGVTSTYMLDPQTGELRFCVEVTDPSFDGLFWDIEIPDGALTPLKTGETPAGWTWDETGGHLRLVTGSSPLKPGMMYYFSVFVQQPVNLPNPFYLSVSDKAGNVLGEFLTAPQATPTPTETETPTATETPTPTASPTPIPPTITGISSTWTFNPLTAEFRFCVQINNSALDGQIWDIEIPDELTHLLLAGEVPPNWQWDDTGGHARIVTGSSPLVHGTMYYFSLFLAEPAGLPPDIALLASASDGSTLGSFTSTVQTQVSATISTDKQSYTVGEAIRTCYTVSQPGQVTITETFPNGSGTVLLNGSDDGRGACFTGQAGQPPGQRELSLTLQTYGGQTTTATTAFSVVPPAPPEGFPLSPNPASVPASFAPTGGECAGEAPYSTTAVLQVTGSTLSIENPVSGGDATGIIDSVGVFDVSDTAERYQGYINTAGNGSGTYSYTVGGCTATYQFAFGAAGG